MRPCLGLTEPRGPGCDSHRLHRPESTWQFEPRLQAIPAHGFPRGPAVSPTCNGTPSLPSCREGGRGQITISPRNSCWQTSPPTVMFTVTQSATALSPRYCGDRHRGQPEAGLYLLIFPCPSPIL